MTFGLRLTDGTTTVTLSDPTTGGVIDYAPRAPRTTGDYTDRPSGDGQDMTTGQYENVVESCVAVFSGTRATWRANLGKVHALFDQARRYQAGQRGQTIKPVYVEFQPDGDAAYWRSEVLRGQADPSGEALDWQWANNSVEITISWERRPYWEGAETTVDLDLGGGGPTYEKTIHNGAWQPPSTTSINSVYVNLTTGAFPPFDVPAPAKITFKNTSATSIGYVWIGQNAGLNVNSWVHMLQGEAASGGSNSANTGASGGNYTTASWSGTAWATLLDWSLSSAQLAIASGELFNAILVSFPGATGPLRAKLQLVSASTVVWESAPVVISGRIHGFGNLRLPPHLSSLSSYGALTLRLLAQHESAGGHTWPIDYLMLLPAVNFRYYVPRRAMVTNDQLVDDGPTGQVYTTVSDVSAVANHVGYGTPFTILPTYYNRFYFLWADWTNTDATVGLTATVKIQYRPRRLTL